MSEYKDKLSAFVDDALAQDEVDALISMQPEVPDNAGGPDIVSRYHVIGEALRGQVSDISLTDVSPQVRSALQTEAAHHVATHASTSSQSLFNAGAIAAWFQSFSRPLAGLAVAASVAMVMVVALAPTESDNSSAGLVADGDSVNTLQNNTQKFVSNTVNVPAVAVSVKSISGQTPQLQPAVNLDAYLNEHNEFAAQSTMQGRLPYARTMARPVGYVSE